MKIDPVKPENADVHIHLRAKAADQLLIDRAAALAGANRSQFMLNSAINAAKTVLLDQTDFHFSNENFMKILDWLDRPKSQEEEEGMKRLLAITPRWADE
jgi:uncharacterized protein (DUF1778 family)